RALYGGPGALRSPHRRDRESAGGEGCGGGALAAPCRDRGRAGRLAPALCRMTSGNPVRAALLCNLALLLFACMDTTTKYLTAHFEVPLVVAARYIGNVVLMLLFVAPTRGREMVWTQRTALVWVRGGCLAAS